MHVMLIDDDMDSMNELANLLEAMGHSCDQFVDVYKALENFRINSYDLVITDLVMPHLDGIAVLKIMRKIKPEAIILVITAFANPAVRENIVACGAYTVLFKPLHLKQFIDIIAGISAH